MARGCGYVEIRGEMDFEGIVGQSPALRHVLHLVETVVYVPRPEPERVLLGTL